MAKQSITLELTIAARDAVSGVVRGVQARLAALRAGINGFISSALRMRNILAGGLALVGLTLSANAAIASMRSLVNELDQAGKAAQSFGLSDAEFLKIQFAAERTGANFEALRVGLTKLQQAAAQGNPALDKLGITLDGLTNSEMLARLSEAFARVESSAERTALAVRLFGEQGVRLLPLLESDLAAISARFDELGGASIAAAVPIAESLKDAFGELGVAVTALKSQMLLAFGPELQAVITAVADVIAANRQEIVTSLSQITPSVQTLFDVIRVGGPVVIITLGAMQSAIDGVYYALVAMAKGVLEFRSWAAQVDVALFSFLGLEGAIADTNVRLADLQNALGLINPEFDRLNDKMLNQKSAFERAAESAGMWVETIKMFQTELGAAIDLARQNAEEVARAQQMPGGTAVAPSGALGAIQQWKEMTTAAQLGAQSMNSAIQATHANMANFFQSILDGSMSAKDAIKQFVAAMINSLIQLSAQIMATIVLAAILNVLTGGGVALAGGIGGFIGSIGSTGSGKGGDAGQSAFIQRSSPNVVPSPTIGRGGGGGGTVQVVNNYISAVDANSFRRLLASEGQALGEIVGGQVGSNFSLSTALGG